MPDNSQTERFSPFVLAATFSLLVLALAVAACGDEEEPDPRTVCSDTHRIEMLGSVGANNVGVSGTPFEGSQGEIYFDVTVESGDAPHILVFTSNTSLDQPLRQAMRTRLDSGANDAGTLQVAGRSSDLPCDPRDGVICAFYGVDANGDGQLVGASEIIYPAASGELIMTQITGNNIFTNFSITFSPAQSGEEPGSESGGTVTGCFNLFTSTDLQSVY